MQRLACQPKHPAAHCLQIAPQSIVSLHCQVLNAHAILLQGLLPRLMRIPPGQAIVWAVSDQITGHFERRRMEAAVRP